MATTLVLAGCYHTSLVLPPDTAGLRAANGDHLTVDEGDQLVLRLHGRRDRLILAGPLHARGDGTDALFTGPSAHVSVRLSEVESAYLRRRTSGVTILIVSVVLSLVATTVYVWSRMFDGISPGPYFDTSS